MSDREWKYAAAYHNLHELGGGLDRLSITVAESLGVSKHLTHKLEEIMTNDIPTLKSQLATAVADVQAFKASTDAALAAKDAAEAATQASLDAMTQKDAAAEALAASLQAKLDAGTAVTADDLTGMLAQAQSIIDITAPTPAPVPTPAPTPAPTGDVAAPATGA